MASGNEKVEISTYKIVFNSNSEYKVPEQRKRSDGIIIGVVLSYDSMTQVQFYQTRT